MSKIVPHLWFDKEAVEAANFYTSLFPNSKIKNTTTLHNTPSGDCDIISFELWGKSFMAISAGPLFKFNPSTSFLVNFDPSREKNAKEMIEATWSKLSEGGQVLMPLDKYPFSERYGWVQDKYGLSWQLILTDPNYEERPPIIPSLMFVKENCGKAEEAINFYLSIFHNSKRGETAHYDASHAPNKAGTVMFADFKIENDWFAAMDSALEHEFTFNESISFVVNCETQEEIDYYWNKLSAVPAAEQCGWLKDKYGLSWQVAPILMNEIMSSGDQKKIDQATETFLKMKKFNIKELEKFR